MADNNFYEELIIAGFGGQGIIMTGKLLAHAAMIGGLEVTYMPSYGAEVRGGTSNCMVVMSTDPVACPFVSSPDSLIIMNQASLDKFAPRLKSGGLLVMNSSMITDLPRRGDIEILSVPADDIALRLASPRSSNMVALGAYLQMHNVVANEALESSLPAVLSKRYHKTIAANVQAINAGRQYVIQQQQTQRQPQRGRDKVAY